jgi:hypothetical protein
MRETTSDSLSVSEMTFNGIANLEPRCNLISFSKLQEALEAVWPLSRVVVGPWPLVRPIDDRLPQLVDVVRSDALGVR